MKKFMYLVFALVLIMGTMGVAYAKWSDSVSATVNVTTDNLQVCIVAEGLHAPFTNDKCGSGTLDVNALGSSCDPMVIGEGQANPPKDVACANLTWVDCHTLNLVVNNAYPFYAFGGDFVICNNGSVPTKICNVTLSYLDLNGKPVTQTICSSTAMPLDLNNDGCCDAIFSFDDNFGAQMEGNQCADESFGMTFLECLPQTSTLHFTLTVNVVQWNEYASACPCAHTP